MINKTSVFSAVSAFKKVAGYAPAAAMIIGSGFMAYDGFMHGRYDVGVGGLALLGIGLELVGLGSHENRIFGLFNTKSIGEIFRPGDRMGILGLAACVALGGGEIIHMHGRHGITPENLMSKELWRSIMDDPASIKVLANLTVYPVASLLDFHKVEEFAKKHGMEKAHRIVQTSLLIGGAAMIARFGELGKIFSARMFGRLNSAAGFVRLGQLAATTEDAKEAKAEIAEGNNEDRDEPLQNIPLTPVAIAVDSQNSLTVDINADAADTDVVLPHLYVEAEDLSDKGETGDGPVKRVLPRPQA